MTENQVINWIRERSVQLEYFGMGRWFGVGFLVHMRYDDADEVWSFMLSNANYTINGRRWSIAPEDIYAEFSDVVFDEWVDGYHGHYRSIEVFFDEFLLSFMFFEGDILARSVWISRRH